MSETIDEWVGTGLTPAQRKAIVAGAIVGTRAIGGTLGHHLARAGHEVTVVDADPEPVRAIREHGIAVPRWSGWWCRSPSWRPRQPCQSSGSPIWKGSVTALVIV